MTLVGLPDAKRTIIFGFAQFLLNCSNAFHFWQDNDPLALQSLSELTLLRIPADPMMLHRWSHSFHFHSLILINVDKYFTREKKNRGPYDHCRSLLFHSSSTSPPSFWPYDYSRSWFASSPSQSDHHPDAVQGAIIAWHSRYCFESTTFVGLSCHPIIIRY